MEGGAGSVLFSMKAEASADLHRKPTSPRHWLAGASGAGRG